MIAKNYNEMLVQAKQVHANAKLMLDDKNDWVIVIPTDVPIVDELPDSYQGTPAWEAYNEMSSGGESVLERWGRKSHMDSHFIEVVAARYNLMIKLRYWVLGKVQEQMRLAGFPDNSTDILNIEDEKLNTEACSLWLAKTKEFNIEANLVFADEFASINERDCQNVLI